MTAPDHKPRSNGAFAIALLLLSIVVMLAGATYIVTMWAITPRGVDLIANASLPSLYFGNSLGWNTLGLGVLLFGIWLAVQAIRQAAAPRR